MHVRVRPRDSSLELEVSDTGIGLPVGLDAATVSTLGLQLVLSLTKQLRGTIERAERRIDAGLGLQRGRFHVVVSSWCHSCITA